jgi:hypothetical protein
MAELSIEVASSVEGPETFRGSERSTKLEVLGGSRDRHGWDWSVSEAGLGEWLAVGVVELGDASRTEDCASTRYNLSRMRAGVF